jgi:hypothetical protein
MNRRAGFERTDVKSIDGFGEPILENGSGPLTSLATSEVQLQTLSRCTRTAIPPRRSCSKLLPPLHETANGKLFRLLAKYPYITQLTGVLSVNAVIDSKKQTLRPLMERFGATENGLRIANQLKEMVGTRRLELLTSTVSKQYSSRPLTQKELITGGTGRTVILGAICYQIATKTWQVGSGLNRGGSALHFRGIHNENRASAA